MFGWSGKKAWKYLFPEIPVIKFETQLTMDGTVVTDTPNHVLFSGNFQGRLQSFAVE